METPQSAPGETEHEEVLDAEVIPDPEEKHEIAVRSEEQKVTLFGTNDPTEVVERVARIATTLKDILRKQHLTQRIGSNDHVQVEGWQTLGNMIGVFAVKDGEVTPIPWPDVVPEKLSQQKSNGLTFGYKASYRAQTLNGAVVGGGEADCKRTEAKWMARDDYALKSMAQTRAQSKALKAPLSFIVTMAGYSPTPAEEMDSVSFSGYESPFGPPMNPHDVEKLARALTFIVSDAQIAIATKNLIEEESGGYFPRIVYRAIVHAAKAARDGLENSSTKEEHGSRTGSAAG